MKALLFNGPCDGAELEIFQAQEVIVLPILTKSPVSEEEARRTPMMDVKYVRVDLRRKSLSGYPFHQHCASYMWEP